MRDLRLQFAELGVQLYASPRYLDMLGEPRHPTDLAQHECLRRPGPKSDIWTVQREGETLDVAVGGRFLLNNVVMIQRLAALDMGIAVLAEGIVTNDVAQGRLRRVLPQWQATPVPVYAMTETRLLPAKTQRFIDFLREHLSST